MKHRYTLDRKRDTEEFIYKYKDEIKRLITHGKRSEWRKFTDETIRTELGYSVKTIWVDIFCSINNRYNRMVNNGLIKESNSRA